MLGAQEKCGEDHDLHYAVPGNHGWSRNQAKVYEGWIGKQSIKCDLAAETKRIANE
jgi:hypothetical protein